MSIENHIVYITTTGEIVSTGYGDIITGFDWLPGNETVIAGIANFDTDYININNTNTVTAKTIMGIMENNTNVIADGIDPVVLTMLPNPTYITISGSVDDRIEVTDTTIEITFDTPGTYTLLLESFPYLNKEVIVNAT